MTHRAGVLLHSVQGTSELWECHNMWLESMQARGLAPKTLAIYRLEVGQFLRFLHEQLNLTTLDAVRPVHIRKWLIHRQQQGVSNRQLRNDYQSPATFWRWCIKEELTTNNPFAKVEKPRQLPTLKPALTPDEIDALLRACDGKEWLRLRDKALILLLLDTGLRIHEAHKLTVEDASRACVLIHARVASIGWCSCHMRCALRFGGI